MVVGVLGCMAQKDQEEVRRRAPHVDMVVGTGQLARVPELVAEVQKTRKPQYALSLGRADGGKHAVTASFESYDPPRDAVHAADAVPGVRPHPDRAATSSAPTASSPPPAGRSRAGPRTTSSPRCRQLADEGCKEVTLIGQTVNSYKFDHGDGRTTRLSDLIARIHDIGGIERIKFVTNFPKDMTDDLLDAVRELPKAVKYLHVPVQSGCDEVLKRHEAALHGRLVPRDARTAAGRRCRAWRSSSDFIVGFCGETEASFQKTMDLVREARFKNSFIFKYSPRPGTKADDLYPDDVPEDVKKRRNNDLLAVQNANSLDDHKARVGETATVLVEGPSKVGERQPAGGLRN